MKRKLPPVIYLVLIVFWGACGNQNPNLDETGKDQLKSLELDHQVSKSDMVYQDLIYVPIYSDIYVDIQNPNCLLAATLSIRNTSYQDSLFVSQIDYFDTSGKLVKSYIDNPISLPPMATVNYVVERDDNTGAREPISSLPSAQETQL